MKPHNDLGQAVGDPFPNRGGETVWAHLANAAVGLWLVTSPAAFGYAGTPMAWSDHVSGLLLIVFGLASVSPRRWWGPWAAFVVGLWLLFAPLVLWSESAAAYANSTLAGIVAIALALVVPRTLGSQELEPDLPPGWSFNPSSWVQRVPIVALAWVSFMASRYLATYQLGYGPQAWDPVFVEGTRNVLESEVSQAFPISDAGLGAVAYAMEALVGLMGNSSRWRTAPWLVALFGVLVVPLGVVSIVLIMLQPLAVGAWCFLCLVTAVTMLIMACLALPEVVGMVQYMDWTRRQGRSVWHTFWHGGPMYGGVEAAPVKLTDPVGRIVSGMVKGATAAWSLVASAVVGVWLLLAPVMLELEGAVADAHYLVGALVVTVSVLAMAEVARTLRWVNLLLAAAIAASPWVLTGSNEEGRWAALAAGVVLIVVTIPRGPILCRYGWWERWIF
ncbi:MAG: vitamin K epoxide reductase family protein [Phycisphaeraceae bacterium]